MSKTYAILGGGGSFGIHAAFYLLDHANPNKVIGIGRNPLRPEPFSLNIQDRAGYEYHARHVTHEMDLLLELLDKEKPEVVTIGTPDHWHVPIAIAAMKAGADVYCEKPLTLTIDEGKQISKVVKETGKVFQVGTQQRSENNERFLKAVAMVHNAWANEGKAGERLAITTGNLDMLRHYRPRVNVLQRPAAKGYDIAGQHEYIVPLLRAAILHAATSQSAGGSA